MTDLRIAIRQHRRAPGFALTVVGTLALTVGATTAVFSVVNAVLVRGLPYASPERLVWVASVRTDNPSAPFTLAEYMDYRSRTRTLSGLAAYGYWIASVAGDGVTERLQGARMSANTFDVLGMSPAAGRLLNDGDDRADAPPVVVVSYRLWQRKYGGAADLVGRTVRINSEPFVIVGVLPQHFPLPLRDIDIVTPLVPDRDPLRHARGAVNFLRLFGRLAAEVEAARAQAELTAICRSLRGQFPVEYARKESVRVDSLHEVLIADFRTSMLMLFAAVALVLATALANLVSLALVRANARRAELAMRVAIGASWSQLVRQLAVEAALLAAIGSALGWLVGEQAIALALMWAPPSIPRLGEVTFDSRVASFVIAVTLAVTALLAASPLAAVARARTGDALRPGRGAIGDRWNHRVRNLLVAAEIAAALVLVLATIALVQNLWRLHDVRPGFNPDGAFQARVSIPPTYRSPDDVARFYDRLSERIAASPGVTDVGVISIAPLTGLLSTVPFSIDNQSTDPRERVNANFRAISAGYLTAAGSRVVQGRGFSETDRSNTPPVALVSAALADRFLSGHGVGQRILVDDNNAGPRPLEIVGIVENVRHAALDLPGSFDIYVPLRQLHPDDVGFLRNNQFWIVRTAGDPGAFRATFFTHLRTTDPDAAVSDTGTMRQFLEESLGPRKFSLGLFGGFALTAALLAVVGLYGLVSYVVSQRAQEIGLRMAIGATAGDVQWMILRQAGALGLAGAAGGLALAAAARSLLASASTTVGTGVTPGVAASAAALLIAVELVAAWLPARRAARIEPTLALRAQ